MAAGAVFRAQGGRRRWLRLRLRGYAIRCESGMCGRACGNDIRLALHLGRGAQLPWHGLEAQRAFTVQEHPEPGRLRPIHKRHRMKSVPQRQWALTAAR